MSEVKKIPEKDFQNIYDLVLYSFHKTDSEDRREAFQYLMEHSMSVGDYSKGKLTSSVTSTPLEINMYHQKVKASGIGYVASYPEVRGNGAMKRLFGKILEEEKKNGTVISLLAPFSYSFYEKFGYEHVYNNIQLTWKSSQFPQARKTKGKMIRTTLQDVLETLQNIYAQSPEFSRFALHRSDWWWKYWFEYKLKNLHVAVYEDENGQALGYIFYLFEGMNFVIHEWVSLDTESFFATMNFIQSHAGAFEQFIYKSPYSEISDLKILSFMPEKYAVEMAIKPFMQARIVSLEKFLQVFPEKELPQNLVLEVHDRTAEWNCGTFSIGTGEKIHLKGEIQAFTSWFMGYTTLENLLFLEKIKIVDGVAEERLLKQKFGNPPVLADYF